MHEVQIPNTVKNSEQYDNKVHKDVHPFITGDG